VGEGASLRATNPYGRTKLFVEVTQTTCFVHELLKARAWVELWVRGAVRVVYGFISLFYLFIFLM